MFEKWFRALLGQPNQPEASLRVHESGQLNIVSIHDLERHRMYERMAQHQRLIEVEDDLQNRF